jgi:hypothetical protein
VVVWWWCGGVVVWWCGGFITDYKTTPTKVVLSCFGLLVGLWQLRISIPQSFYCMQSSSGNKRSVRVQSGLSARLVDEKELVDKNYHKFKGFLNRND